MRKTIPIILALLVFLLVASCDDLKEQSGETVHLRSGGDDFAYPYFLVIGGGLSETLSVLRIDEGPTFELFNDVAQTGASINDTVLHENKLYAVCSLSNSVVLHDTYDLAAIDEFSIGSGKNPMNLAFVDESRGYIANLLGNSVSVFDFSGEGKLLADISIPSGQDGIWSRPTWCTTIDDRVYCALANLNQHWAAGTNGAVTVIDPQNNTIESIIAVQGRDTVAVVHQDNAPYAWVLSAGDFTTDQGYAGNGVVEKLDLGTGEITDIIETGGAPFELAVNEKGIAYLGNGLDGRILTFDTETLETGEPVDLREGDKLSFISALAMDGHGLLYAAEFNSDHLVIIDTLNDNEIIAAFTVNDGPDTLTFVF